MISNTADYALRALLLLARENVPRAVRADVIAERIGAPRNYIGKVLNAVAKAGLITSARGPSGGFALAIPANEITIGRVIDLFDGVATNPRCMMNSGPCDPSHPCSAHDVWKAVSSARRSPFNSTTIADLLEGRVASFPFETNKESRNVA
jgi:Rrf2 family protein